MGMSGEDSESSRLLTSTSTGSPLKIPTRLPPCLHHLLYAGRRFPPSLERLHHRRRLLLQSLSRCQRVDRISAVVYMLVSLFFLLLVIAYANKSDAFVRINVGLAIFILSLLAVPIMDVAYIKGQTGLYSGFHVTVAAIGLSGLGDA